MSPNYPDEYDILLDCEYRIVVAPGTSVDLTFVDFSMEGGSSCQNDYLELYDVVSGVPVLLGVYCGTDAPPDTTSTENELRLVFHSDSSVGDNGFLANYVTNS
ncbi:putative bone morphogenetic protein 1-like [Apostichopus japonicus]|uniref:Putative bone morphogenetic protein 1-like n=2 Tax=Stichopus japonicus TaxID=307972 RepID=A0A2G8KRN0_STIJA|nr:putative bone morphogenetic protein 1-like [Apostichopus japonicus]